MTTQPTISATQVARSPRPANHRGAFTALARRRTWVEFGYALVGLPIGVVTFGYAVVTISVGASLAATFLGIPLLAASCLASRWLGSWLRSFANAATGSDVPPPPPLRMRAGALGWMRSRLTDGAAWRAQLYFLLKLPVGVATFTAAVTMYASGLVGLTYWAWRPLAGCDSGTGPCHQGPKFGAHHLDTPTGVGLAFVAGIVVLLVAPWVISALIGMDKVMVARLLGSNPRARRVTTSGHSRPR